MRSFIVVLFALASVCAAAEWDGLKATYRQYHDLPWGVKEATAQNKWVKIDEDKELKCDIYSQPNDARMMLLFDSHGTIAGIRLGFLKEEIAKKAQAGGHTFPVKHDEIPMYKKAKYFGKEMWYIATIFALPSKLASGGRRPLNKATDEVADGIYFNDGSKWVEISKDECKISPDFTEANCYPGMGKHYFYKMDKQQDCSHRASLFPLYLNGRLCGLGLGSYGSSTNNPNTKNYFENISGDAVKNIVPNGPKCMSEFIDKYGYMSVHLFFKKDAEKISCPQKDWRSTELSIMFGCCLLVALCILSSSQAYVRMIGTPVVFTNNNGGGADELQVPLSGEASKLFDAGSYVRAAWWVPYDNIGDLPAIHRIDAVPSGNHVNLVVHGSPHQRNGRVRIKIYADILG